MGRFDTNARRSLALALALAGGCAAQAPEPGLQSEAVHDEGLFELDQNAIAQAAAGDDWETLYMGGGSSTDSTGVLPDAPVEVHHSLIDSTTLTGGSKDDEPIGDWVHTAGSSPDKDEITNAYAASYLSTSPSTLGDHIVYFGMDRIDTSGNANMGFWFLQQSITANSDGSFTGEHTVGDILVQVDFANGGSVPNVRVLEWVGSGGEIGSGTLHLHTEDSADCVAMDPTGQDLVCATTNASTTASPWTYIRKGTTIDGPFPPNSFVEGGINVSDIFGQGAVPCFASFVAVTRASDSVTAALHDFVYGSFQACGIEITKTCDQGTVVGGNQFQFAYHLTIDNTGSGTLYDVTVTDDHSATSTCTPALGNQGSLIGGGSITINCTFTSPTNPSSGITNNASVTAASVDDGPVAVSDSTSDLCEPATVTPGLTVSKTCSPRLEVINNRVVVATDGTGSVCNTGNVNLTNVVVTDDCGTAPDQTQTFASIPVAGTGETGCRTWNLSCAPNQSGPNPYTANFPDRASATGYTVFNPSTNPVNSPAMTTDVACYLCPQPPG